MSNYSTYKGVNNITLDVATRDGTGSMLVPKGTTAQRPVSPVSGYVRYNTTLGYLEQYNSTGWSTITAPPTITSVASATLLASSDPQTITINGSNFDAGSTVTIIGANGTTTYTPATVTYISQSQIQCTFTSAGGLLTGVGSISGGGESYGVKVTASSGLATTLTSAFNINDLPTWTTTAGSLGTVIDTTAISTITLSATDPEGGGLTYAVSSGALPGGLSLSTGGAITGTPSGGSYNSSGVTYNFTASASDGAQTAVRSFSILKKWKDGTTSAQAAPSAYAIAVLGANQNTNGTPNLYYINTPGGVKQIYCKFYGDNYGWMLSHTFGGTNALTTNDNYCLVKGGFWMTTEQMGNLPASYSLSGTMSTTKDTKLRFSDGSNNYQTTAGSSAYWSLEGTANSQGSSYGSSNPYFYWWAHSGNIGHLHIYGDLSGVYPSNTTHALWEGEMQVASSPQSFIADYQGNAIYNNSGSNSALITIPSTIRAPLGPLNGTGSHGYWSDGNGTTEQTRALWVGSSS